MPSRNRSRTSVKEHRAVRRTLPGLLHDAEQLLGDPLSDVCWEGHEYEEPPPPRSRASAEQRAAIFERMLGNIEAVEARLGFGKEG